MVQKDSIMGRIIDDKLNANCTDMMIEKIHCIYNDGERDTDDGLQALIIKLDDNVKTELKIYANSKNGINVEISHLEDVPTRKTYFQS